MVSSFVTKKTVALLFCLLLPLLVESVSWIETLVQKEMVIRIHVNSEKGYSKAIKVAAAVTGT